jgi:hypothetical protein
MSRPLSEENAVTWSEVIATFPPERQALIPVPGSPGWAAFAGQLVDQLMTLARAEGREQGFEQAKRIAMAGLGHG